MMEALSFSKNSINERRDFFIQSDQDGLFFGLECLQSFLKSGKGPEIPEVRAYFHDGDCVFKGQTLLRIDLKNNDFSKEDLVSIISYLSGVYTLVSCWTERNFNFSIMAGSTPGFSFPEWEKQAILKAGAGYGLCPANVCFDPEEVRLALDQGKRQVTLSHLKMSKEEIKSILQSLPPFVETSLKGSFFPADLEELRPFCLKSVYPLCLQGFFPCLKMKVDA